MRKQIYITICLSVFCILTSVNFINAQVKNSKLRLIITNSDSLKKSNFSYSIYQGDTLKSITKIPNTNKFAKEHLLRCGKYIIHIYRNDSIYHQFEEIELECGFKMDYHINLDAKTSYEMLEKSEADMFSIVSPVTNSPEYYYPYFSLGYGTKILEEVNYPVQHLFRLGAGGFLIFPISRHLGLGYNPESTFELALPFKNADFRPLQNYRHERYFYWSFKLGLFMRLTTFNMKQPHKGGMFLDLGANYNLPIYFRLVGLYENHKDITRFIHKFNDVSLTARIGSDKLTLYGQYRLFDFVKYPYPQMPLLSFGLIIRLEA